MCSIRNNWQHYTYSILLLIIVLASNSCQQKLSPQPFQRFSKSVNENDNGFKPIVGPIIQMQPAHVAVTDSSANANATANKNADAVASSSTNFNSNQTKSTEPQTAIAQVDKPADQNEKKELRSINIRMEDVENLAWEFMKEVGQSNGVIKKRSTDQRAIFTDLLFNSDLGNRVKIFAEKYIFQAASASTLKDIIPTSGRLFLFKSKINSF